MDPQVTLLSAATGGADIETEEDFRSRGLLAWQNPPQGGSDADYKKWALEVSGVTRAWVKRRLNGAGTVGVYIMCDRNDNGGFPVGTDGISQLEDWGLLKPPETSSLSPTTSIRSRQTLPLFSYVPRSRKSSILKSLGSKMPTAPQFRG